jgi:hypothetical protein
VGSQAFDTNSVCSLYYILIIRETERGVKLKIGNKADNPCWIDFASITLAVSRAFNCRKATCISRSYRPVRCIPATYVAFIFIKCRCVPVIMHHEVLVVVYRTARTRAREAYAYGHFFTAYDQREDRLFRSKQTNIMRGPQQQLSYQTFNQTHEKILAATCACSFHN